MVNASEEAIESNNRLSMNRLSMNRLSMNSLSKAALSPDGAALVANELINDEPGRELLTYMVRCALPSGKSLTLAAASGVAYSFYGQIGLATDWVEKPLTDKKKQRFVTACLLAHVNGYGIEVPISLRGPHPALYASQEEKEEYWVQETAFYGNAFDDDGSLEDDPRFFSCGGYTLRLKCGDSPVTFRPQRSCADSASCALAFEGMCRSPFTKEGNACKASTSTGYKECYDAESDHNGHFPWWADEYKEIITVYLRPQEFSALYMGCDPI